MKNLVFIILIGLSLNTVAGTGGINGFLELKNDRIDAGTGGVVGGVDDLDELKDKNWNIIRDRVRNDYNLDLQGDIAFVGKIVSVFNVCIENDKLRSIKKMPVYKRVWLGGSRENDRFKDVLAGSKYYSYPIESESEERRCYGRKDNRCKVIKKVRRQSLSPSITLRKDITRNNRNGDRKYVEIFTKKYDIPYCN
ncbi:MULTISPECIES: hypothetical protein [Halobacteriovorax]|uniref:Uncharacterized protein n=1 Tax=Halobacteriovorax vibrionivorans TaxID=2152716 RepID=A0ABY0ILM1_9BACT|nr:MULTISPECIES: hypothetical protein [Halobacteriovorax]RZF22419.1 hypothetical protein DAY19_01215 [Halobacteriovorax vibrionivorans]TGD47610.1 hypothetical protein EP118_06575 [Halobacteriovorax sp. Y22]